MATFFAMRLVPGDVVDVLVGVAEISPEELHELKRLFGLERPIHEQYFDWLSGILKGDWGHSFHTGRPILQSIMSRLPVTYELAVLALAFAVVLGIPAGIISAALHDTSADALARFAALIGLSVPDFWLGTMIILLLSKYLGWLPPVEFVGFFENPVQNLSGLVFPALTLATGPAADAARMLRASLLEVYGEEFIRTARAKGLAERAVALRHAMPNALIPVVTVLGIRTGYLLAGAVIVEAIFSVPGMGRFLYNAVFQRDYAVVQASVLVIATTFAITSFTADVLYVFLDPRIRHE